jgi:Fe-S-cluster containining protein
VSDPNTKQPAAVPEALQGKRRLEAGATFCFECSPKVDCFTRCCADVNIVLTPADVLALARATGLSTREFLDRHTLNPITKELHVPVVMLRMDSTDAKRCPFVGEKGCSVYDARPWACRMYPVATALPPARPGVKPELAYFLSEDDFCHGRTGGKTFSVDSWQRDQGIGGDREELEQAFQDLVGHPWFIGGRQLEPKRIELFYMAAYDLDTFREFVFSTTFVKRFDLDPAVVETIRRDDRALLLFGLRWLRFALFGEPTIRVRAAAQAAGAGA